MNTPSRLYEKFYVPSSGRPYVVWDTEAKVVIDVQANRPWFNEGGRVAYREPDRKGGLWERYTYLHTGAGFPDRINEEDVPAEVKLALALAQ